jgi:Flp pilus assembly protein TadD
MKTYFEQNIKKREFAELVEKYTAAAGADRNAELAAELARQIEALDLQDPEALNDLAWDILTSEKFPIRDLPFATRLAKQALEATGGQQGHILDTYARALFDAGQVAEAIEYQKRAVAASPGDAEIQAALARYQAAAETAP